MVVSLTKTGGKNTFVCKSIFLEMGLGRDCVPATTARPGTGSTIKYIVQDVQDIPETKTPFFRKQNTSS